MDKRNIFLFGGSQWWILPDCILESIVLSIKNNDRLFRTARFIYGPDETFFQTMIMNGQYSDLVEVNKSDMVLQNCMTYALFSKDDLPSVGHPYTFSLQDKDLLKEIKKNHFFARKFDISTDEAIVNWIEDSFESYLYLD